MALSKFEPLPATEEFINFPPAYRQTYLMVGVDEFNTVNALAAALLPQTKLSTAGILYLQPLVVNRRAYQVYEVETYYGPRPFSEFEITLSGRSTGGETIKILGSLETVSTSANAPDFQGLIGYNPTDQSVEGVDIPVPSLEITITMKVPAGFLRLEKIDQLAELKGKVNSSPWMIWQIGEVRFDGAEFSEITSTATAEAEISYIVSIQKTLKNFESAGLTITEKQGWDYLWLLTEDDVNGGLPIKRATHYYVERTMPRADFAAILGFGGA